MNILITILSFLFVLALVIIAHELGHFGSAKAFGIKVDEFGIGFPPRLFSIKRGETIYSLNAIPLGGFTKMAGEEDPNIERSLASQKPWKRLLVLSAGSIMNFVLPFILISIALMIPHNTAYSDVVVVEISPDSPAENAGFQPGDAITLVNGHEINSIIDVNRYIQLNLGKEITLTYLREGTELESSLVPRWKPPKDEGSVGFLLKAENYEVVKESLPFWKAIPKGITETFETLVLFKNSLLGLATGAVSAGGITGPLGIAQLTGEVARAGVSPLLEFAAFLSINLGIINLLPLPALDGGRIVFVLLEWVRRGKKISPQKEGMVHLIGFALLMALMLIVTFQDIIRIFSGGSVIP
ncbi:MAG: RIP metalloprotease RseP [Dehalococcoidales bacterium]|jgi:regulator of sigma E protease|nr:RIP metalloprotease RseP [Dehalococcoidales bacterium]MDD4466180.1 RIP metalloprotease RseP [Dehalococcoidales bacterium]MDD5402396.1 RIP metalloprotease RseP [Dehalococcoidales bacterium]